MMGRRHVIWLFVKYVIIMPIHVKGLYNENYKHHEIVPRISEKTPSRCLPAMMTKSGVFSLTFTSSPCRSIILAPPGHVIEFAILRSSITCDSGYVALFGGMRTSRVSFPDVNGEWEEFCDVIDGPLLALRTEANVGMLGYLVGEESEGSELFVNFVPTQSPCNMVVVADDGAMEMESSKNCSILLLNSKVIKVTEMNIGMKKRIHLRHRPMQSTHGQCINSKDKLEILGGSDSGENYMEIFSKLCGRTMGGSFHGISRARVSVPCPYAMVRLTSSGAWNNRARFEWTTIHGGYDEKCL